MLRGIVQNRHAQKIITEDDMDRFIATRDTDLLCRIAERVNDFEACDLDTLCEKLADQKEPEIRYELASNSATQARFLKQLADDEDVAVARAAGEAMENLDDEKNEDH